MGNCYSKNDQIDEVISDKLSQATEELKELDDKGSKKYRKTIGQKNETEEMTSQPSKKYRKTMQFKDTQQLGNAQKKKYRKTIVKSSTNGDNANSSDVAPALANDIKVSKVKVQHSVPEVNFFPDTPILAANMNDTELVQGGKKVVYIDHQGVKNPKNNKVLGLRPILIIKLPHKPNDSQNNNNTADGTNHEFDYYAMDQYCYHMAGELNVGDIEDIGDTSCISCPVHNYLFDIKTGEELRDETGTGECFTSAGVKQRCHKVDCNYETGDIFVTLNFDKFGKIPSDLYAAINCKPVPPKEKEQTDKNLEETNEKPEILAETEKKLTALPCDYQNFKLVEKIQHNHNTYLFKFGLNDSQMTLGLPVGKHIKLKFTDQETGNDIIRSYTPMSDDKQTQGYFELLIKVYEQGKMSQHLTKLNVNDEILISGPSGAIEYQSPGTLKIDNPSNEQGFDTIEQIKHIGMIAGGTGITPMYQVINYILQNSELNKDDTKISLIFANNTIQDILLKQELESLATKHPNQFHLYFTVAQTDENCDNWQGGIGFVSETMMQEHLPAPNSDTIVMLCGPPVMNKAMKSLLCDNVGFDNSRVVQF